MLYSSDEPGELSQWLFVCCVCLSGVCFAVGVCTVSWRPTTDVSVVWPGGSWGWFHAHQDSVRPSLDACRPSTSWQPRHLAERILWQRIVDGDHGSLGSDYCLWQSVVSHQLLLFDCFTAAFWLWWLLLLLLLLKSRDYSDTITQKHVAGALYSQYRNVTQTRRVRRQFQKVHTVVGVQRAEANQSSSGKEPSSALCSWLLTRKLSYHR